MLVAIASCRPQSFSQSFSSSRSISCVNGVCEEKTCINGVCNSSSNQNRNNESQRGGTAFGNDFGFGSTNSDNRNYNGFGDSLRSNVNSFGDSVRSNVNSFGNSVQSNVNSFSDRLRSNLGGFGNSLRSNLGMDTNRNFGQ